MKVRMKTIMAGPNGSAMPGQVIDLDNCTALNLVAGGYAEIVERWPIPAETAMIEPTENTDARPNVKAKRGRK